MYQIFNFQKIADNGDNIMKWNRRVIIVQKICCFYFLSLGTPFVIHLLVVFAFDDRGRKVTEAKFHFTDGKSTKKEQEKQTIE